MLKTYQFKIHCKGDSHSSKTANIIFPGLMIKQRVQAIWYSNSTALMFVETTHSHLTELEYYISLVHVRALTFVLSWVLAKWYLQF